MASTILIVDTDMQATILAALRFYQEKGQGDPFNRSDAIHEIATNGGEVFSSLDDEGISQLCENINLQAATPSSLVALLQEAVDSWPQFDCDDEVDGGNMVEWFGEFRERVEVSLADLGPFEQRAEQQDSPAMEPRAKWFAVTGRIPGDNEDSCHAFKVGTREEAVASFENAMYEDEKYGEEAREATRKSHGVAVFINAVVMSAARIEEV